MKKAIIIIFAVVTIYGIAYYVGDYMDSVRCNRIHDEYEGSPLLNHKLAVSNCYYVPSGDIEETDSDYKEIFATFEKTYSLAKKELLAKGWVTYIPDDFKSAKDEQFPEIGDCGSGVDAVCFVNFKKGDVVDHLNLQIGGKVSYGSYKVWTVVGSI